MDLHESLKLSLNEQLRLELEASHLYLTGYAFFSKIQLNLPGISKFCKESCAEERGHADKIVEYINLRGGNVKIPTIEENVIDIDNTYDSILTFFTIVLHWETKLTKVIIDLHKEASKLDDVHLTSYLEDTFIPEQYQAVAMVKGIIEKLERMGPGLGLQTFDSSLLS